MAGIQGFFVSRTGMLVAALSIFVIIPMLLIKMGIENAYTEFFGNPFTSFAVVFILGVLVLHKYIRTNIIGAGFMLGGIAIVAYLYVYTLIL